MLKAEIIRKARIRQPRLRKLNQNKNIFLPYSSKPSARTAMPSLPAYFAPKDGKTKIYLLKTGNCRKPRMRREKLKGRQKLFDGILRRAARRAGL